MNTNQTQPVFMGGTLAEHKMFVLSVCRFEHISNPLILFHYVTWSIGHVSAYVIAERLFGPIGGIAWASLLIFWSLRMDARIGAIFGLMETGYALLAGVILSQTLVSSASTGTTAGLAFAIMFAALLVEVASHVILQGQLPGPPPQHVFAMPKSQFPAIGIYFAVVFGLFFLNLDLAMRLFGYRPEDNRRLNEITNEWHRKAAAGATAKPRIRDWHLRVMVP